MGFPLQTTYLSGVCNAQSHSDVDGWLDDYRCTAVLDCPRKRELSEAAQLIAMLAEKT